MQKQHYVQNSISHTLRS